MIIDFIIGLIMFSPFLLFCFGLIEDELVMARYNKKQKKIAKDFSILLLETINSLNKK